jgi:hypothetical protein
MLKSAPLLPLNEMGFAVEFQMAGLASLVVKLNCAYVPRAMSGGHVVFSGWQLVWVWAKAAVAERRATRAEVAKDGMVGVVCWKGVLNARGSLETGTTRLLWSKDED